MGRLFDSNMLYVAISRATKEDNIFLFKYSSPSLTTMKKYHFYIIKNKETDKVYIGHTLDIKKRFEEHKEGKGTECRTS